MGTKLDKEYSSSLEEQVKEEEQVKRIIEESNKEYENMNVHSKIQIKTVLIIAGTMILIAMIGKILFNIGNSADKYNNSNKKITNTIDVDEDK